MTKIEWTEETWNPFGGCSEISAGCMNCYAKFSAHRMAKNPNPKIAAKYAGTTRKNKLGKIIWTGNFNFEENALFAPLKNKKPTQYFISMTDVFHENVKDEWIDKVMAIIALCPQHTFQILTKRAERMNKYFSKTYAGWQEWATEMADFLCYIGVRDYDEDEENNHVYEELLRKLEFGDKLCNYHCLINLWLGVSVENQANKYRIDLLRQTPAAIRFISFEPLLDRLGKLDLTDIDWAIFGGESGFNARPCNLDAIRDGLEYCRKFGVAPFVKQLGAWAYEFYPSVLPPQKVKKDGIKSYPFLNLKDKKGGNIEEFPTDLQIREYPK